MVPGLSIEPSKERHHSRWFVLFLLACLLAATGWYGYHWYMTGEQPPVEIPIAKANPAVDESDVTKSMVNTHSVPATHPRYISIPAIGVKKTRVFEVGLTKQNMLDTPKNIHDAAWYNKSQTPGVGYGAVLINAHNGGIYKDGVFASLHQLKRDDEIIVERGDGKTYEYRVVENRTMSLDEVNETGMKTMMKSARQDREGLNLITCAGKWVPRIQQFDQRIMLRAVAK